MGAFKQAKGYLVTGQVKKFRYFCLLALSCLLEVGWRLKVELLDKVDTELYIEYFFKKTA